MPTQRAAETKQAPQTPLVIPFPGAAPAPSALRNETGPEVDAAIHGAEVQASSNPVDGPGPLRESSPPETPNSTDIEGPQTAPAVPYPEAAPAPSAPRNEIGPEVDAAIHGAEVQASPHPVDGPGPLREASPKKAPNILGNDTSSAAITNLDEDAHTGKDARSGGLPPMSEPAPSPERNAWDLHTLFLAKDQIMDAAVRLTDAVAQLLEAADRKNNDCGDPCGLLHFRQWWELVEVTICVGGRLISGIPIFIEKNTLRVVDRKHSYFIPLGKVDYICTSDGLCSDFQDSEEKAF